MQIVKVLNDNIFEEFTIINQVRIFLIYHFIWNLRIIHVKILTIKELVDRVN